MSGEGRRSIAHSPVTEEEGKLHMKLGFTGGSKDTLNYMVVMEKGRAKGKKMPPSYQLILWVMRVVKPKIIRKGDARRARRLSAKFEKTGKIVSAQALGDRRQLNAYKSVAFLIARKIAKEGIKAKEFYKQAFEEELPKVAAEFEAQFAKEAGDVLGTPGFSFTMDKR